MRIVPGRKGSEGVVAAAAQAVALAAVTRRPAAGRPLPRTATPTAVLIVPGPFACAVEEGEAR